LSVLVILNGVSRKKKLFYRSIYPLLKQRFDAEVWETQHAGHAEELASIGVVKGFNTVISAGGDGTMHQVINGVMKHDKPALVIGLIPLGSGNDLARALGAILDPKIIIDLIQQRKTRLIDVGSVTVRDETGTPLKRFFINECSIGMGPEVVRRLNERSTLLGPALMYLKSIVNPSLPRFLMLLQVLKRPAEAGDKCLTYRTSKRVRVTSEKALPVEADGEPVGFLPLTCEVAVRKLNFLC
jgi:diacylglycerol kinase (ATP)